MGCVRLVALELGGYGSLSWLAVPGGEPDVRLDRGAGSPPGCAGAVLLLRSPEPAQVVVLIGWAGARR